MWQELKTHLAKDEAGVRHRGSGNTVTGAKRVKPQRFNGFMYLAMFHQQFEAIARHNCVPREVTHLLAILQGKATDVLHSVPAEMTYQDTAEALEGCYRDHQVAAVYCSQLKVRTQLNCECL
jgi:hypothetical protein